MSDTIDNETTFNYNGLPNELLVKITESFAVEDRHRFAHVSRKSRKMALVTDDYVYGIELFIKSEFEVIIRVHVPPTDHKTKTNVGYCVKFEKIRHKIYQIFTRIDESIETSKTPLVTERNVIDLAMEYYKQRLVCWKRCIRRVMIASSITCFEIYLQQELENLQRLEILYLCHNIILPTRLKLKQPLRSFSSALGVRFFSLSQIFKVHFNLSVSNYRLTIRQFEKLSAKVVFIPIGGLTEEYLFNFVNDWVIGTRKKQIYEYRFCLRDSNFDNEVFFEMYDIENIDHQYSLKLENKKTRRSVHISAIPNYILFHFTDRILGVGTPLQTVFDLDL